MNAAMRWIVWGTIPLGTLTGGAIATGTNLTTALWVGAIGELVRSVPLAAESPSARSARCPSPVEEPTPAQAELEGGLVEGAPLSGTLLRGCVGRAAHSGRTGTS